MGKDRKEHRIILISEQISKMLSQSPDIDVPVYRDQDVLEKTLQLVKNKTEGRLQLLFFLSLEELTRIYNFLKGFDQSELVFTSVIFSEELLVPPQSPLFYTIFELRTSKMSEREFQFTVEKAFAWMKMATERAIRTERRRSTLIDTYQDLDALIDIGKSLTLEKDNDKLLRSILYLSKKITGSDAGSIYVTETNEAGERLLRFKYSHTFSKDLSYEEFTLPVNTESIAGYVAATGMVLNIPDVYELHAFGEVSFAFNRSFDEKHNYRTKSMIVVPMRNQFDQTIGVIQLINCKEFNESLTGNEAYEVLLESPEDFDKKVVPFAPRFENLLQSVAGQAAIALENNRMIRQIKNQFEEFVKASVVAIESQDPATSGHSFRVADLCVHLARIINLQESGPFADVAFSEIQIKELEYASLLHDFGKVYIEPAIFLKGQKLFPKDFDILRLRLNLLYRTLELELAQKLLVEQSKNEQGQTSELQKLQSDHQQRLSTLREIIDQVEQLNKPTVMQQDRGELINQILEKGKPLQGKDPDGQEIPLLTAEEIDNLKIPRGTLNAQERGVIESHVEHTYTFVSKIPWPPEYRQIPEIALRHHEKLDGSGYPHHLKGRDKLPLQSRIMTIADIYDALSAADRPYKKAVNLDRVFNILRDEASQNKLDSDLVELFITEKAYQPQSTTYKTQAAAQRFEVNT
ncbi:MAG TPA: GAF domain-containing protein [bacterium]|nr:GAF domain-containing protein [bacterium]